MNSRAELQGYLLTRWLFLRLLGLVYLIAFASLAVQITGLVGEHGIMPAGQFLEAARSYYGAEAYWLLPTVFWLGSGNLALGLVSSAGIALALLLVLGVAPRAILILLWVLYLSLSVAGQDFLSFQWDALLLEAGLLAVLWAPAGWLPRRTEPRPSELARWVLVFLLFKLMFLSGITKLVSGDPTWRALTALDYHFETQPLPPWTAWYAHQLPGWLHRGSTLVMFLIEIGAPFLLFAPARLRPLRIAGCAAIVLFQLGIAATGNYGFFNLLTIVLCVPALDDGVIRRLLPIRLSADADESRTQGRLIPVVAPALLFLSMLSLVREVAYTAPDGRGQGLGLVSGLTDPVLAVVAPFRSINGYGLFRVMTTERPELAIEGSRDGVDWIEYEFRYKPGPVTRAPEFVAPYHPRLDWQMWFAALSPAASYGWLQSLAGRLRAGTPAVVALVGRNPFPDAPPQFIRLVRYDYRFSTRDERRRTGAWWVRKRLD
jgi:hypothetical protein